VGEEAPKSSPGRGGKVRNQNGSGRSRKGRPKTVRDQGKTLLTLCGQGASMNRGRKRQPQDLKNKTIPEGSRGVNLMGKKSWREIPKGVVGDATITKTMQPEEPQTSLKGGGRLRVLKRREGLAVTHSGGGSLIVED